MADEIDQMQERNEKLDALRAMRKPTHKGPTPTGRCHYCDETISSIMLFCDSECSEGWEHEQKAIARNGGAR